MYYEEKLINGILMFRTALCGGWQQCSIVKMGQRIQEMKDTLAYIAEQQGDTEIGAMAESHL